MVNYWRHLWKDKAIGSINIGGLAVGMAAAFLVLLWVQNEFSFDSFQPDANREYLVAWVNNGGEVKNDNSPLPLTAAARTQIPGVEAASSYDLGPGSAPVEMLIGLQPRTEKKIMFADGDWFSLFQYDFIAGNARGFGAGNKVVLTATLAKDYFGTTTAVSREIRIDSNVYTVMGVVRDNPANSSFQQRLFLPLRAHFASPAELAAATQRWTAFAAKTFIRLKPGASKQACEKAIDELMKTNWGGGEMAAKLVPLKEMHFGVGLPSAGMTYGNRKVAIIFGCLGALLLLIACINYVNLATARASLRVKEISMKKIMGAGRRRLFGQFMMEALLTGAIALVLTVLLIWLALPAFDRFTEENFAFSFGSPAVPGVLLITWLVSVAMTGVYPAILLSAFDPLGMLQADRRPRTGNAAVRKGLVVVQFTAAVALILGTIVIYSQLNYIQKQSNGYDKSQIFSIRLPRANWFERNRATGKTADDRKRNAAGRRESMMVALTTELRRQPAIRAAGFVSGPVMEMPMSMAGIANWDGRPKDFNPQVYPMYFDPVTRRMFGLALVTGKWFAGDSADRHNYILNETAAASFGLRQPYVGQRFSMLGDTGKVIGIVKDFHFRSLHEKIAPVILWDNPAFSGTLYIQASPNAIQGAVREAGEMFRSFFPGQEYAYTFLDEDFDRLYKSDIKTSRLIAGFAGVAVLLSCFGLLGLAVFTARQREKEIATRKVLGARVRHIVVQLSGGYLRLVGVSLLIACPIGWWAMNKWLEGFAYRTGMGWWMFAWAGGIAIGIAFLTVAAQAVKAAVANPAKSLRNP